MFWTVPSKTPLLPEQAQQDVFSLSGLILKSAS